MTTLAFGKQMAAILELHFRYRFCAFRHYRHVVIVVVHWPGKFHSNRTTRLNYNVMPIFQDGATA